MYVPPLFTMGEEDEVLAFCAAHPFAGAGDTGVGRALCYPPAVILKRGVSREASFFDTSPGQSALAEHRVGLRGTADLHRSAGLCHPVLVCDEEGDREGGSDLELCRRPRARSGVLAKPIPTSCTRTCRT